MNIILTPKEKAQQLKSKFGNKAVAVVNEILKHSPNRPLEVLDPLLYFQEVRNELKNG